MNNKNIKNIIAPLGLFVVFFIICLNNYKDYGIAWDEEAQHLIGEKSYEYVTGQNKELLDFWDRDYGVAIELPLIFIEKALGLKEFREIYLMRRLVNHSLFLLAGIVFYFLAIRLFKSKIAGVSAALFLFLHPRIYAHSFYNTKDIPLLCFFIFSAFLLHLYFNRKNSLSLVCMAIVFALTTNIRIIGVLFPLAFIGLQTFNLYRYKFDFKYVKHLLLFFLIYPTVLIISWPYLWESPLDNFLQVFENMSKFRWTGPVLFQGESILTPDLPPYYLPVWLINTTPILFLVAGGIGVILFLKRLKFNWKEFLADEVNFQLLIQFLILFGPVTAIIVLKSVVYDGWRQVYFIYPSLALFAAFAVSFVIKKYKKNLPIILSILFIPALMHLYYYHPYQGNFFNEYLQTKSKGYLLNNYEMDYWGTSYGEAMSKIVKKVGGENIKICAEGDPGKYNYEFLPSKYKSKVDFVKRAEADYFITNLRWSHNGYDEYEGQIFDQIETPSGVISITYRINK